MVTGTARVSLYYVGPVEVEVSATHELLEVLDVLDALFGFVAYLRKGQEVGNWIVKMTQENNVL